MSEDLKYHKNHQKEAVEIWEGFDIQKGGVIFFSFYDYTNSLVKAKGTISDYDEISGVIYLKIKVKSMRDENNREIPPIEDFLVLPINLVKMSKRNGFQNWVYLAKSRFSWDSMKGFTDFWTENKEN